MATVRRRSQGFDTEPETASTEEAKVNEFLEEVATEMFETISQAEEEPKPETKKFVEEAITPSEDPGPRFVETPVEAPPVKKPEAKPVAPKRHPRNIPKFSRHRKP